MATDALGVDVQAGDIAVYVRVGSYTARGSTTRGVVLVLHVMKKVRVRWLYADQNTTKSEQEEGFFVEPSSLFLVRELKGEIPTRKEPKP